MRSYLITILTAAVLPLSACNLYFSGGDDPDPCEFGGGGTDRTDTAQEAPEDLRNPQTGMCESFWGGGGGGGWPCDDACGPCPGGEMDQPGGAQAPIPTWGSCEGMCNGLEEASCLGTPSCRGIYTGEGFQECWQTDNEVPDTTDVVDCNELEAQDCSRFDYCSALHTDSCSGTGTDPSEDEAPAFQCGVEEFVSCFPETPQEEGCFGDEECGEGFSCNASEICLPPPSDTNGDPCPEELCGVPQPCYGFCVPEQDPGECDGEVFCDAPPPICPADSVPGISNGCFTGYCIPLSACPSVPCEQIQSEAMCVQSNNCNALYEGVDCQCTPESCECGSWIFDSCETIGPVPPTW